MVSLIPRDHWEHRIEDVLCGFGAGLGLKGGDDKTLRIPGLGDVVPVRSGRVALVTAIRALGLPRGAHIGVPLYCCPVVFSAIVAAGCAVRFVDCDTATFCISSASLAAKAADLDALIAVHLFGNVCDVPALKAVIGSKPIIEDCAQALGSRQYDRPVGMTGDLSVFSFRSGKYLSVGEGGAVFANQREMVSRAAELVAAMPTPSRANECVHVAVCYAKALLRSKPLYGLVGHSLWHAWKTQRNSSAVSGVALSQIRQADLAVTLRRLSRLEVMIEQQRKIADFYSRTLNLDPGMLCYERPRTCCNRYHYPIIFPSAEIRDLMAAYLYRRGIDSMKYLEDVVAVASNHYGYEGGCPVAEQFSKRVLVIPSYYTLRQEDVEYVVEHVNAGWTEITGGRNRSIERACPEMERPQGNKISIIENAASNAH